MSKVTSITIGSLVLLVLLSTLWPLAHDRIANGAFQALLSDDVRENPATVEIITAGQKAVFSKGTEPYQKLLRVLHEAHSQPVVDQAGPPPNFGSPKSPYGEIVIHRYRFPLRFKLVRSNTNRNYFWIAVPHVDGNGTHLPLFALGSEFVDLVDSASLKNTANREP